jgi:dCTP deaminase
MSFLSSESVKKKFNSRITPFDVGRVEHGAYEMALGRWAFTTDSDHSDLIKPKHKQIIKPGQMALLLTEEEIKMPSDMVGFISIKAGVKFRGLINISGFHVDPGFCGHLKFSVYNAGSDKIYLERQDPTFLICFGYLDRETSDTYDGTHGGSNYLTSKDVEKINGEIPSPSNLDKRVRKLENRLDTYFWLAVTVFSGIVIIIGNMLLSK